MGSNPKQAAHVASVRIGRSGLIYLVVTGLILGAAIHTQANLLFWSLGLMIGGVVVSVVYAWQALRGLTVVRLPVGHGVADGTLVLRYQLTNGSWLPVFSVTIREGWGRRGSRATPGAGDGDGPPRLRGAPHAWVMHLGPGQTAQAEAPSRPLRRGVLQFEHVLVETAFPFGVLRKVVRRYQPQEVLILPQLLRVNRHWLHTLTRAEPNGRLHRERGGGIEEFFGVRPYRPGDSLRLIDWKHTARNDVLVAKDLTQPDPPQLLVWLDLFLPKSSPDDRADTEGRSQGHEVRERAISLAASLICEGYQLGYQVGLEVAGEPRVAIPLHHSLPHRTRLLEALARLAPPRDRGTRAPRLGQPSVVIHCGQPPRFAEAGLITLGPNEAASLIHGETAGEPHWLPRRARPWTRRRELEEAFGSQSGAERVAAAPERRRDMILNDVDRSLPPTELPRDG